MPRRGRIHQQPVCCHRRNRGRNRDELFHHRLTRRRSRSDSQRVAAGRALGPARAIARLTPAGALDPSFDGDGKAITDIGGTDTAWGLAIQPDGKIVAAGQRTTSGLPDDAIALVRYHDAVRLYVQQDANFNVTAVTDSAGTVLERYVYEPYGSFTVHNADWSADEDGQSDYGQTHLHQGGRYDAASGLYHFRNRDYSPTLGRWAQQDPMGYVDGMSLYEYVKGAPRGSVDPWGLWKDLERNSQSDWAPICAEDGDTWVTLAELTKLAEVDVARWVRRNDNTKIDAGEQPRAGSTYKVPNVVLIVLGKGMPRQRLTAEQDFAAITIDAGKYASEWAGKGFKTITSQTLIEDVKNSALHGFIYVGHGAGNPNYDVSFISPAGEKDRATWATVGLYLDHFLAFTIIDACDAEKGHWENNVSERGWAKVGKGSVNVDVVIDPKTKKVVDVLRPAALEQRPGGQKLPPAGTTRPGK